MKISKVTSIVTVDLSEVPAYMAYGSHEKPDEARMFKPHLATVDDRGEVNVYGHRIKKNGEPYAVGNFITYWGFGPGLKGQPEFVQNARKMADNYRNLAMGAWARKVS